MNKRRTDFKHTKYIVQEYIMLICCKATITITTVVPFHLLTHIHQTQVFEVIPDVSNTIQKTSSAVAGIANRTWP